SAKRRLKKRRRKEARRARDINHKIAKHVVAEAERTGRGIALEDLTGIRERVRLAKPLVERWFAELTNKQIRRGVQRSVQADRGRRVRIRWHRAGPVDTLDLLIGQESTE
ncbi:hypothetical protein ACIBK0_50025, partial [Streptomyces sp. NPDC050564]